MTAIALIAAIFFGDVDVPHPATESSYTVPEPWRSLAECESHGQWDYGRLSPEPWGSNRYHGGLQFHGDTWSAFAPDGFPKFAWQASPFQQVTVAERVLDAQGWKAWPTCSLKLGLRGDP